MLFPLILGIILGALSVTFALQNIAVITVSFFHWQLSGSLSLILLLAVLMGVLITLLIILPESIRNYFKYKNLQHENKKLADDLQKQKELTFFAKKATASPETIEKIEQGAIEGIHIA